MAASVRRPGSHGSHPLLILDGPMTLPWMAAKILLRPAAELRGKAPDLRRAGRQERSRPLVADLFAWLSEQLARLPGGSPTAQAIRYALNHRDGLVRFLEDGRIELDTDVFDKPFLAARISSGFSSLSDALAAGLSRSRRRRGIPPRPCRATGVRGHGPRGGCNNTVERAIRPICLSRKNALFASGDDGGARWAAVASLVETCKLNGVDPQRYFTDVLTRLVNGWPNGRIDELMPWCWTPEKPAEPQPEG
jgi:hypothetical protein